MKVLEQEQWLASGDAKLLQIYSYYRTLLSAILLLMFATGIATQLLGQHHPTLFFCTLLAYTVTNVACWILFWQKQFQPQFSSVFTILLMDIVAIVLLMYASGGTLTNLGYLLLICIAAGGIFLRARLNLALAGFASILVLTQSLLFYFLEDDSDKELFGSAVLGILLFATALVFSIVSERIRKSTQEASEKAEHAEYLEKLSQLIIERMRTGILVVDNDYQIVLLNHAAKVLLGRPDIESSDHVHEDDPLYHHLRLWKAYPHTRSPHIKASESGPEVRVSFAQLDPQTDSDTLVFVEDNRLFSQEAQQLKLASLGRLTASIAHEVRNPLAAISHASQLLQESSDIPSADLRLTEIIQNHSLRVNQIIENVLQLSRRKSSMPEVLEVNEWLQKFINDFSQGKNAAIEIDFEQHDIKTRFDLSQLEQVLTNLCENGLRYSEENTGRSHLVIRVGLNPNTEIPFVEIIDDGIGVPEEDIQQIFEPFFTTASTGSGLGLYICRELCEANQASLEYRRTKEQKSCFRINLSHHERVF